MNNNLPEVVLASSSQQRLNILNTLGIEPIVISPNVDESVIANETPEDLVVRLSKLKAQSVDNVYQENRLIVSGDCVVVVEGSILGKPSDAVEAKQMLSISSGKRVSVLSGLCVIGSELHAGYAVCEVQLRKFSDLEIDAYISTGEYVGRAGGFSVQDRGSIFIESIKGEFTTAVGLSCSLLNGFFTTLGYPIYEWFGLDEKV